MDESMTELKFCQSCGMPFDDAHKKYIAKEKDGSDSIYCTYCYQDGEFTDPNASTQDMIEMAVPYLAQKIGEDAARKQMETFIPTLARWQTK